MMRFNGVLTRIVRTTPVLKLPLIDLVLVKDPQNSIGAINLSNSQRTNFTKYKMTQQESEETVKFKTKLPPITIIIAQCTIYCCKFRTKKNKVLENLNLSSMLVKNK